MFLFIITVESVRRKCFSSNLVLFTYSCRKPCHWPWHVCCLTGPSHGTGSSDYAQEEKNKQTKKHLSSTGIKHWQRIKKGRVDRWVILCCCVWPAPVRRRSGSSDKPRLLPWPRPHICTVHRDYWVTWKLSRRNKTTYVTCNVSHDRLFGNCKSFIIIHVLL